MSVDAFPERSSGGWYVLFCLLNDEAEHTLRSLNRSLIPVDVEAELVDLIAGGWVEIDEEHLCAHDGAALYRMTQAGRDAWLQHWCEAEDRFYVATAPEMDHFEIRAATQRGLTVASFDDRAGAHEWADRLNAGKATLEDLARERMGVGA